MSAAEDIKPKKDYLEDFESEYKKELWKSFSKLKSGWQDIDDSMDMVRFFDLDDYVLEYKKTISDSFPSWNHFLLELMKWSLSVKYGEVDETLEFVASSAVDTDDYHPHCILEECFLRALFNQEAYVRECFYNELVGNDWFELSNSQAKLKILKRNLFGSNEN